MRRWVLACVCGIAAVVAAPSASLADEEASICAVYDPRIDVCLTVTASDDGSVSCVDAGDPAAPDSICVYRD